MQWLIAIIALLSGSAVGALVIRRILLKQHAANDGELSQLRLKNVEMQTTINIQQQQFEAEKQLLKDSFARENKPLPKTMSKN